MLASAIDWSIVLGHLQENLQHPYSPGRYEFTVAYVQRLISNYFTASYSFMDIITVFNMQRTN